MRATDAADFDDDGAQGGLFSGLLTWAGAALGLALVIGLGSWFAALGTQDPERIPVISASLAVVKERPADDGPAIPHADVQSYDAGAPKPGLELTSPLPAPPQPRPADRSMGALARAPAAAAPLEEDEPVRPRVIVLTPTTGADGKVTAVPVPAPADDGPPVEVLGTDPDPAPAPSELLSGPGSESPLAPVISLPAPSRPGDLRARNTAARAEVPDPQTEIDRLVALATDSAVQIQLGAFPDKDFTIDQWRKIQAANSDILGGRTLVLQTTESGGTTFYRLRVGPFATRAEAQSICTALKARKQPCLVATNG